MELEKMIKEIEDLHKETKCLDNKAYDLGLKIEYKLSERIRPIITKLKKAGIIDFTVEHEGYVFDLDNLYFYGNGTSKKRIIHDTSVLEIFVRDLNKILAKLLISARTTLELRKTCSEDVVETYEEILKFL